MKVKKIREEKEVDELEYLEYMVPVKVPTMKERREKGLTDEECIRACYEAHRKAGRKCFRELNYHNLCDLCPKKRRKISNKTHERNLNPLWR